VVARPARHPRRLQHGRGDRDRRIKRVADELWHDPDYEGLILAEPEVWGVEELAGDRLVLRLMAKTRPREQWKVARELRARIKAAFDEAGIEVPKS